MGSDDLLELDGSAGGGQLVRTALALSMATERPFRMDRVRGERPNPGLRAQHLAAVRAAASVCDAEVEGAELGSEELTFRPGTPTGGHIEVEVGTAGSVALVFDALAPLALVLDEPLVVTARGGTDVQWSPTAAFYRRAKVPLLRDAGLNVAAERDRAGFYPAGDGRMTLLLAPSSPPEFGLTDRGSLDGASIYSTCSADLADAEVARRQAASAAEFLRAADVPVVEQTATVAETPSTGSSIAVVLDYERTTAGFDALGERGTPAEEVGDSAATAALSFREGSAAVDAHTADQLVAFLALVGGRVRIPAVTAHVRTGLDLVEAFGLPVSLEDGGEESPPTLVA